MRVHEAKVFNLILTKCDNAIIDRLEMMQQILLETMKDLASGANDEAHTAEMMAVMASWEKQAASTKLTMTVKTGNSVAINF